MTPGLELEAGEAGVSVAKSIVHCSEYWPTSNPDKGYLPRYRLKRQLDLGSKRSSPRYVIINGCMMCVCVSVYLFHKNVSHKGFSHTGVRTNIRGCD